MVREVGKPAALDSARVSKWQSAVSSKYLRTLSLYVFASDRQHNTHPEVYYRTFDEYELILHSECKQIWICGLLFKYWI